MPETENDVIEIRHPDIEGVHTATVGQLSVLAKSGWVRATTATRKGRQATPSTPPESKE